MGLSDDILYVSLLIFSIGIGKFLRLVFPENLDLRKRISTVVGLATIISVSGIHALHCLASVSIQGLTFVLFGKSTKIGIISFFVQFSYLFFFRLCSTLGIPQAPPHTNAIQMMLALKLIGIAFEANETRARTKELKAGNSEDKTDLELKAEFQNVEYSFVEMFYYSFNHAGALTGPYYKFRTFQDLYSGKLNYSKDTDCDGFAWKRIQRVPFYVVAFLLTGYLFPLSAVKEDDFYETTSVFYRLVYMTPIFFNFRMRLYTGFVLSECSCIMAGLGSYPEKSKPRPGNGPTVLKELPKDGKCDEFNFETVHNIDEYSTEVAPTMRAALKTWNMTVQYWLAVVVYKRFPSNKTLGTIATMIVSSVWHGVHPGYYLSLGSVPFVLMVEDLYDKILRRKLSEKGQKVYDFVSWFFRVQQFTYLGMGFQLLQIDSTIKFWRSVYFVGHLVLPIFYVLGLVVVKPLAVRLCKVEGRDKKTE